MNLTLNALRSGLPYAEAKAMLEAVNLPGMRSPSSVSSVNDYKMYTVSDMAPRPVTVNRDLFNISPFSGTGEQLAESIAQDIIKALMMRLATI